MSTGIITDIQKFSLHDGPGIRSTIFLKGCNMRCIWCHNPETYEMQPQEAFYKDKCIGCGHCKDGCPTKARIIIGREMTADEVCDEIISDLPYYQTSGGGITLSGGEPLIQADFAAEILSKCQENNIDTAIETNLSLPYEQIKKVVPYLNRIYFDIKLFNDDLHKQYTGVSNKRILENAHYTDETGLPFIVRTPLIPGITDTDENIAAIAAFLKPMKHLQYYELLSYNSLAGSKYEPIHLEFKLKDVKPLPDDRIKTLIDIIWANSVKAVFRKG